VACGTSRTFLSAASIRERSSHIARHLVPRWTFDPQFLTEAPHPFACSGGFGVAAAISGVRDDCTCAGKSTRLDSVSVNIQSLHLLPAFYSGGVVGVLLLCGNIWLGCAALARRTWKRVPKDPAYWWGLWRHRSYHAVLVLGRDCSGQPDECVQVIPFPHRQNCHDGTFRALGGGLYRCKGA